MKECEWCGIDFRGPCKKLDNHFFCSDNCEADWRLDVRGVEAVEKQSDPAGEGEGDVKAEAEKTADGAGK